MPLLRDGRGQGGLPVASPASLDPARERRDGCRDWVTVSAPPSEVKETADPDPAKDR